MTGLIFATSISLLMNPVPASAGANNAPGARSDTIKAVVVRSFGQCEDVAGGWTYINDHWEEYGSIPVTVDFADPSLCDTPITYSALVASAADVMIISNPCAAAVRYSQQEMNAIRRYAQDGHTVIGTFLLFGGGVECSHSAMAPLFGYRALGYGHSDDSMSNRFHVFATDNPLFRNLPNPFPTGHHYTELPPDGTWSHNELSGAVYLAKTGSEREGVISIYTTPQYSAIRASNAPEYDGGPGDAQFLYNAIIYPSTG